MAIKHKPSPAGVFYDSKLINQLKEEHQTLFHLLWLIHESLEKQNYLQAATLLSQYREAVLRHVTRENLKLYVYLRDYLKDHPEAPPCPHLSRHKVNLAQTTMINFFENYKNFENNPQKQQTVLADFKVLNTLVTNRMQAEETFIFPLYSSLQAA